MTAAAGVRVVECDDCGRPLTNPRSRGRGCQHKRDAAAMLPGVETVIVAGGLL